MPVCTAGSSWISLFPTKLPFFCKQHSQGNCESQERWHHINALPWCWPAVPSLLFPSPLTIYFCCIFNDQMFKVEDVDHSWVSKNTLHKHASQSSCCWYTWNIYCAPEVGNNHCSISWHHYTEHILSLLNRILFSCILKLCLDFKIILTVHNKKN